MAATTYMRSWSDLEWVNTATMPLFLFSATFYPLSVVRRLGVGGAAVAAVPRRGPDAERERRRESWTVAWGIVGHVAFLLTMSFAGLWVVSRRLQFLLVK